MGKVVSVGYLRTGDTKGTELEKACLEIGHGVRGDDHAGMRRFLDVRVKPLTDRGFTKGQEMLNYRQLSIISLEEMNMVIQALEKGEPYSFGCLAENILVEGIEQLTQTPFGNLMLFKRGGKYRNPTLLLTGENEPCLWPGKNVHPENPSLFVKHAKRLRGITAMVLTAGKVEPGDECEIVPWK